MEEDDILSNKLAKIQFEKHALQKYTTLHKNTPTKIYDTKNWNLKAVGHSFQTIYKSCKNCLNLDSYLEAHDSKKEILVLFTNKRLKEKILNLV